MSRRDPSVSLRRMRDHAAEAVQVSRARTRADVGADRIPSLALVRLLEILGEATNRILIEERTKSPRIPWTSIAGLRCASFLAAR